MSLASTVMAPHLVDWYVDIYTNSYGSDTVYQNVINKHHFVYWIMSFGFSFFY